MALSQISSVSGTIQKFFEKSWMDMPQEGFETPLANSSVLETATLPKHSGQYVEFRKFNHFDIETESADDTPKTYSENSEPSSGLSLSASVFQVPFTMIADWIEIGNVEEATDPISLVKKAKEEMYLLIKRKIHRLTNGRFVKSITDNLREDASTFSLSLPQPLKTIYAGGVASFEDLTADNVFSMADFKRARSLLRNSNVPGRFGRLYACYISEAIKDQLLEDAAFNDAVKRHADMYAEAHGKGVLGDHEGMRWMLQDDEYRCGLPGGGGGLTTRANDGQVLVAHIVGRGCAGYVDFGGSKTLQRRRLRPKFKVQDTSKTGTGPSIGWRMPYQACVIDRKRGLNVVGTSRYTEDMDDIV